MNLKTSIKQKLALILAIVVSAICLTWLATSLINNAFAEEEQDNQIPQTETQMPEATAAKADQEYDGTTTITVNFDTSSFSIYVCRDVRNPSTYETFNLDAPYQLNISGYDHLVIGLVLVWKIKNTYKACFDIDVDTLSSTQNGTTQNQLKGYDSFVNVQSDAALRKVAGMYAYDNMDHKSEEITLRSGGEEINEHLEEELRSRLSIAGIEVVEARINYLAYAAEIASVMLRRQQADAIISAREKIVEGAVSMVDLALKKLSNDHIVELDEDKKATMVSNLLVVLCADESASPVINTGTLYQ